MPISAQTGAQITIRGRRLRSLLRQTPEHADLMAKGQVFQLLSRATYSAEPPFCERLLSISEDGSLDLNSSPVVTFSGTSQACRR